MQRNKVHAVTTLTKVAQNLDVSEDMLHDLTQQMDTEDGVIWVYESRRGRRAGFNRKTVSNACATSLPIIDGVKPSPAAASTGCILMMSTRPRSTIGASSCFRRFPEGFPASLRWL